MKITVTNISTSQISTDLGLLLPNQSKSVDMNPLEAYNAASGLKTLSDAGRIVVTVTDETSRLDTLEKDTTSSNLTLYVETTGRDTNPGTKTAPFLTIQAALDSLPRRIRHLVSIRVGIGNFAGFQIKGFSIDPVGATAAGLSVQGTLIPFVPATGSATGATTSITAPGSTTPIVANDSLATFTVSDLKGKLIEMTSGTSLGTLFPICANTATAITIPQQTGTIGGGNYAIQDWGTVITGTVKLAPDAPILNVAPVAAVDLYVYIANNTVNKTTSGGMISIERMKILISTFISGSGIQSVSSGQPKFRYCQIANSGGGTSLRSSGVDGIRLTSNVFIALAVAGTSGMVLSGDRNSNITLNYILNGSSGIGVSILNGTNELLTNNFIDTGAEGIRLIGGSVTSYGGFITGCAKGISINGSLAPSHFALSNTATINSSTTVAIEVTSAFLALGATFGGTGSLVGVSLLKGARCSVSTSVTMTGTTEVSIDGVSSTWATMRAASPKLITNTYGTIFYE